MIEVNLAETSEIPANIEMLNDDNVWVFDTGASNHFTKSNAGATNIRSSVKMSQGMTGNAVSNELMDLRLTQYSKSGVRGHTVTLTDVCYNRKFKYNLFSPSRLLSKGWKMKGDGDSITMTSECESYKFVFDIVIRTPKGAIYATILDREVETSLSEVQKKGKVKDHPKKVTLAKAHELLGHCDIEKTRRAATRLGWQLSSGVMPPCSACAAGKAKQRNVPKVSERPRETKPGAMVSHDISTIGDREGAKAPHKQWHLTVDNASMYCISEFFSNKDKFIEPFCKLLKAIQTRLKVKNTIVRMDNSGENKKFVERSTDADWQLNLTYEFTSSKTPQQNSLVEVQLATIAGRARAMLNQANVPLKIRIRLSNEVLSYATKLGNIVVDKGQTKTRYERFGLENPKWASNPKEIWKFGEAAVVKRGKNGKLGDRGVVMIHVGYADDHASDCHRMFNPATGKVSETRDVIRLYRWFYQDEINGEAALLPEIRVDYPELSIEDPLIAAADNGKRESGGVDPVHDEDDVENELASLTESREPANSVASVGEAREGDDDTEVTEASNDSASSKEREVEIKTKSGRVTKKPFWMTNKNIPFDVSAAELRLLQAEQMHEDDGEIALVGATGVGFSHTSELKVMNYKEAMNSDSAAKWQVEVDKEHKRMVDNDVWSVVDREKISSGAKPIDSTWAMKLKADGTMRARMNARGFKQIPGQHYEVDNISSPVTNTASIRIAFTLLALASLSGWVVDVKGAFLLGEFKPGDPIIYMEVPEGMTKHYPDRKKVALRLKKCLYGTKQAAKYYYNKVVDVMKKINCERSKADPCLFFRWDEKDGLILWLTWIDDKLCIANPDVIKDEKEKMKQHFECDDVGEVVDYIGCKVEVDREDRSVKFTQPVLVQSLVDEFEDIPQGKDPLTPAKPGDILLKSDDEKCHLGKEEHTRYRTGVGKLLYLAKHSRPDIANAVRELSRHAHCPTNAHWDAMCQCIRYVRGTPTRGLLLKPFGTWDGKDRSFKFVIRGRSDSNYATDKDTRRSVTGTVVYLNEAPIVFGSVTQKHVTLSVTEAELAAGVSLVQDMMYVYRVVTSMGLLVELPMLVEMDNSGAKDLANSWSVGGRTRHVDVRMFFLRELKEDGFITIKHVPGNDNEADIFTKNVDAASLHNHVKMLCGDDGLYESLKGKP